MEIEVVKQEVDIERCVEDEITLIPVDCEAPIFEVDSVKTEEIDSAYLNLLRDFDVRLTTLILYKSYFICKMCDDFFESKFQLNRHKVEKHPTSGVLKVIFIFVRDKNFIFCFSASFVIS